MNILDMFNELKEDTAELTKNFVVGVCRFCNSKMIELEKEYNCLVCGRLFQKTMLTEIEPVTNRSINIGNNQKIYITKSANKSEVDIVGAIKIEFMNIINQNGSNLYEPIMDDACLKMCLVTKDNIIKKTNRMMAFAACIYYSSIECGHILSPIEIIKILGLKVRGISRGKKILLVASKKGKITLPSDYELHKLYVKKYLNVCDENIKNLNCDINTQENIDFCIELIEFMLENNIVYNSTIPSICVGVIYYLLYNKYGKLCIRKKRDMYDYTQVGQNTFIKVYNSLISADIQSIIPKKYNLKNI